MRRNNQDMEELVPSPANQELTNQVDYSQGAAVHNNVLLRPTISWLDRSVLATLDWEKLLYIAFIAIAILSRFWDLGARVMSHDESLHTYFSFNLATGKGFSHTPLMHGPFLFHITALSYFLFGDSDFTSRIPPAIFGVVLVALPYLFRKWLGRGGSLMTSFALLISPSILFHARYIRQDEFILVWTLLSVLCVWRYLATRHHGWLVGLTIVLALHATDKSTSFLTIALFAVFLAPLVLFQLYNTRRRWIDCLSAIAFTLVFGLILLAVSILFILASQFLATRLGLTNVVAQLNPLTLTFDAKTIVFAGVILILTALTSLAAILITLALFRSWLRFVFVNAPAFNLLLVMVTTTMFMASPALLLVLNPLWRIITGTELIKVSLLGDMANLATNPSVISTMFALSMALIAVSVALGVVWNWRRWLPLAGIFLAITATLFTTVFTNAAGFGTGFVGQLGYWMAQQDVQRGSQPPYYYFLIVPMYEYMLIIGSLCAIVFIAYRIGQFALERALNRDYVSDTSTADTGGGGNGMAQVPVILSQGSDGRNLMDQPLGHALIDPVKLFPLFLVWWTLATWVIYTLAGEKMPWLTVHFALPMALLTGWFLNHVVTVPGNRDVKGTSRLDLKRGVILVALAIFVVLLIVRILSLIGGLNLYPNDSSALIQWLGAFLITAVILVIAIVLLNRTSATNGWRAITLAVFGFLSILTIRTAFMVTYINYDYTREFLFYAHGAPGTKIAVTQLEDLSKHVNGDMSLHIGYDSDVSWPMSWYMRDFPNARFFGDALPADFSDLDAIMIGDVNPKRAENEAKLLDNYTRFDYMLVWWPMQDYFDLTWDRISYSLFNPQARAALWDIAFNRDFTLYSQVFNKTSLTPDKWSPGHRFALYIRNDVASKVWSYRVGAVATGNTSVNTTTLRMLGPATIALAPNGDRYVIDHKANRVLHLDQNGSITGSFGGAGAGPGKFNDPWGIAIDKDGSIFVADTFNHRIQKFDANGNFMFTWGTPGVSTAPGSGRTTIFFGPRAIVIDVQGRLFVSDTGNKRIQVFDSDGNYLDQFGSPGSGNGQFSEPVGIAIDASGNIYVADTWNQRIQVFDSRFKFLRTWTVEAWKNMDQNELQSVDHKPFLALSGNTLLVSSPKTHQVLGYTLDGNPVELPGVTFAADVLPTGLVVQNSTLMVTNANNGPVVEFQLPGR
jgi:uncharacterized protein (TIGR03663 family)